MALSSLTSRTAISGALMGLILLGVLSRVAPEQTRRLVLNQ